MKRFMDEDFLLPTQASRDLYRGVAADLPIFDYHSHLRPADVAADRSFSNLAELWLEDDHYKWRQMRAAGIDERFVTGDAEPYEKFLAWARTVERLAGNPLYHWTHLELKRFFGIVEPLTAASAPRVWDAANEAMAGGRLSVKAVFGAMRVFAVGTTDDPADALEHHEAVAAGTAPLGATPVRLLPTFRPDRALGLEKPGFASYVAQLSAASGVRIESAGTMAAALERRLDFFVARGCRSADHALDHPPFRLAPEPEIDLAFAKALAEEPVSPDEAEAWRTRLLVALASAYASRGIAMQLHIGALRDANGRAFRLRGADSGCDAANDRGIAEPLANLLDAMQDASELPKTLLFALNPKDDYSLGTLAGAFNGGIPGSGGAIPGKIQTGPAWWFADHRDGIERQLRVSAALGGLAQSVGMTTDSRSFLSFPRHEYYRRILCGLVGSWIEEGSFPAGRAAEDLVADVCFRNAARYFN